PFSVEAGELGIVHPVTLSRGPDARARTGEPDVGGLPHDGGVPDVLERFTPATQDWFRGAFDAPTPAQVGAWEAISDDRNALVVAPTGSGKTLSAFLWAIDSTFREKITGA